MLPMQTPNHEPEADAEEAPPVERRWSGDIAGQTAWRIRYRYADRVLDLWSAARPLFARLGEGKDWA